MMDDPARQILPDDRLQIAGRLYQAFAAHDATALLAVLAPGFRGVVCEGMPQGLGGAYDGAETMLRACWARVFALLDLRPVPAEYLPVAGDRMVVLGRSRLAALPSASLATYCLEDRFRLGGDRRRSTSPAVSRAAVDRQ